MSAVIIPATASALQQTRPEQQINCALDATYHAKARGIPWPVYPAEIYWLA